MTICLELRLRSLIILLCLSTIILLIYIDIAWSTPMAFFLGFHRNLNFEN